MANTTKTHTAVGGTASAHKQSMAHYTYTIFDDNPNSSSGTAWPTHQNIPIESDSDDEAIDAVLHEIGEQAAGLSLDDGYDVGQFLYAIIWDDDGVIVGEPTYKLSAEDLGVSDDVAEAADS